MKIIRLLNNDNPYINLATEEFLLKEYEDLLNEDLFIIWKNKNTIVIGNSQNALSEINILFTNLNNIKIVRRMSGGGAVFHDDGNINFTFIKRNMRYQFKYETCLNEIISFFNHINIFAKFSGRNDILIDDKKVSGTAVTFYKNDYLIHGTLLFDINIEKLVNCLTVNEKKLISKGIKSVKSRVTNIKECLNNSMNAFEFEKSLIDYFENKYNTKTRYLSFQNNPRVLELVEKKYANYEYIFGKNYDFNFKNSVKLDSSIMTVIMKIENGNINEINFYSDHLHEHNIFALPRFFINQKYEINNIKKIIDNINLKDYDMELTPDKLIELMFNNV